MEKAGFQLFKRLQNLKTMYTERRIKKKALFEIVSNKAINYGGGGSRTPVLTVHPSTSTGLDPADESRFPAAVGQS